MTRPRLLDLYCGAGGAAVGYSRAGFDVVGVDIAPQPNFPFEFHQGDAIEYLALHGREFDAIHASPPCQHYSRMSNCRPGLAAEYPDMIPVTRAVLDLVGVAYVIENVDGSTVRPDITLCGQMFGLPLYRHRLFESNVMLEQPPHPEHLIPASKAGHWRPGTVMSVSGHVSPMNLAREAMGGIDWMTRDELVESIPPQFAEHVGAYLLAATESVRAA
jgi:DNA (cytosine-5)-methyltransferase 1